MKEEVTNTHTQIHTLTLSHTCVSVQAHKNAEVDTCTQIRSPHRCKHSHAHTNAYITTTSPNLTENPHISDSG